MTTVSEGQFEEFPAGEQMLVRVNSGEVKIGAAKNATERSAVSYVPDYGWFSWEPTHGETLYVYGVVDSDVTVQYNDGFSVSLFGFPILDVDADAPNTPDQRQQTTRIPAEGVRVVDESQTDNVADGGEDSVTIQADAGEVWTIADVELQADATSGGGSSHRFVIQTEDSGIELGFGSSTQSNALRYASGSWTSADNAARDNMAGTRIDEDSGVDVIYRNDTGATQTATRTIQFSFEVVKT